jgi:hypothetical protein
MEMERKCSNRRMAGEIRKTKYQSIRKSQTYSYIHKYVCTHTHTHICTSIPTNTTIKLHILSLKGVHTPAKCRETSDIQTSYILGFQTSGMWCCITGFMLPDVPLELPKPVTQLTWHHTPVTPLYKPQNPLIFHLHLTIIEYIRIRERVAQCNVLFVVASN